MNEGKLCKDKERGKSEMPSLLFCVNAYVCNLYDKLTTKWNQTKEEEVGIKENMESGELTEGSEDRHRQAQRARYGKRETRNARAAEEIMLGVYARAESLKYKEMGERQREHETSEWDEKKKKERQQLDSHSLFSCWHRATHTVSVNEQWK